MVGKQVEHNTRNKHSSKQSVTTRKEKMGGKSVRADELHHKVQK